MHKDEDDWFPVGLLHKVELFAGIVIERSAHFERCQLFSDLRTREDRRLFFRRSFLSPAANWSRASKASETRNDRRMSVDTFWYVVIWKDDSKFLVGAGNI